jgi:pSer/pThr/pTyr-binding forkhead associated (FHA) protein
MQAVLVITSGADAGKRIWLKTGQIVDVGRTDAASFTVPGDRRMSSRHFELRCDRGFCVIRDLRSSNGTLVNGQQVAEAPLRDGDTVVAGETHFAVHLEGVEPQAAPPPVRVMPDTRAERKPATPPGAAAHRFGHWACARVPGNWTKIEKGFRQSAEGRFPATLILVEAPAPEQVTLVQFARTQAEQIGKAVPGATAEGPVSARVAGADEAVQLTLCHPRHNNFALVQRCVFARRKSLVGTSMLVTSESDLRIHAGEFAQLLDGLALTDPPSG